MDIMASMMLIYSWLKFTDTALFPMNAVTCLQTSNIKVFKWDESSSCAFTNLETRWYRYILYDMKLFTKHYICMNPKSITDPLIKWSASQQSQLITHFATEMDNSVKHSDIPQWLCQDYPKVPQKFVNYKQPRIWSAYQNREDCKHNEQNGIPVISDPPFERGNTFIWQQKLTKCSKGSRWIHLKIKHKV